jgi:hypothetical protein
LNAHQPGHGVSLRDPQNGGIDELSEINVTPFMDKTWCC